MVIMLADDHPVVRNGIQDMLADTFPGATFLQAGDGDEVLTQLHARRCDLLLLDIAMPGRSGLEILAEVKRVQPRLPVIMMSVQPEEQYAPRCIRAGASGYVNKASSREELVGAVQKALSGGRYVSIHLAEMLAFSLSSSETRPLHDQLSNREFEVLRSIVEGKHLTEIAQQIHLSIKTVSTYRSRILQKMGMQSNAELTRYALENHILN